MDEDVRRTTPLVHLGPRATADLELALAGLLRLDQPAGGDVGAPDGPTAPGDDVVLELADEERAAALGAGRVDLVDAESTPFVALRDVREVPGHPGRVRGRLLPLRASETGPAREHRWSAAGPAGRPPDPAVVLRRPPLVDDLRALAALRDSGRAPLLLAPDAGPTPDGVPAEVLVRAAVTAGRRAGLDVATVPVAWRGEPSDTHLVEQVAAGTGAQEVVVLRAAADAVADRAGDTRAAAADAAWDQLLRALRRGDAELPAGTGEVLDRELRRWSPPRSARGLVVLLTGLSGSGKSTLARGLHERLVADGRRTSSLLDGDVVRRLLSAGLGFDAASRDLNVRRIGFVASEVARHGGVAVCAPIAPYERSRRAVREMAEAVGDFLLVHVSTPLEECERRDLKGLYARARAGEIPAFTGVSDPYEAPVDADLRIDTSTVPPAAALDLLVGALREGGWLPED